MNYYNVDAIRKHSESFAGIPRKISRLSSAKHYTNCGGCQIDPKKLDTIDL